MARCVNANIHKNVTVYVPVRANSCWPGIYFFLSTLTTMFGCSKIGAAQPTAHTDSLNESVYDEPLQNYNSCCSAVIGNLL